MKLLLLWDIDGTLLSAGGAGRRAMRTALARIFGLEADLEGIEWAGRTDQHIVRQILIKYGLPDTEESVTRYLEGYLADLPAELARSQGHVLPGVSGLLETVAARADAAQGLLTGNLRRGAQVKLAWHGLWDYFPFGAFANDAEQRNELGPYALRRARDHTGFSFAPEQTWVIGDTPHDIACGKALGARTLAVATGPHALDRLQAHAPTATLPDLTDPNAFWRAIEG